MSVALAEPNQVVTPASSSSSSVRAEASRANGRLSHGPVTPEGKEQSRQNGCKEGLTGAGIVLPKAAATEVDRREAEFAHDLRPRNAVERELVRQMALGAWRSDVLGIRIIEHDDRMNAARFANWEQDEQLAALEIGQRLADDPEAAVTRLRCTSAGCDWLISRWLRLGNGLYDAEEGGPRCTWTDADLALILDLRGRSQDLRHLDIWPERLETLREQVRSGSAEAVAELGRIIEEQVTELEAKRQEVWEGVEEPQLQAWRAGVDIDLGPEGTRLRRYEAAASRLFRSSWTRLERLRKESGLPMMPRAERGSAPEYAPAPPPPAPPPPAAPPLRRRPEASRSVLLDNPDESVLDIWACGPPRVGMSGEIHSQYKTNPTAGRNQKGTADARPGNRP